MKKWLMIVLMFLFQGCFLLVPRKEVVIDKKIIPNQCPTFNYEFNLKIKKPNQKCQIEKGWVFVNKKEFLTEMMKYKEAKEKYNEKVKKLNEIKIIKGTPHTENYKRVIKIIYVKHKCPKFNYEIKIHVYKKVVNCENFYLIKMDNLLYNLKKFKILKKIQEKNKE